MFLIKEILSFIGQINRKYYFDYFIVLLLALTLFSWLQASPTLPEPDSFYHAKIAQFISQGKILHQFPWLSETSLKDNFVDHHFLYHLLLAPFVKLFDPLVGVKVATVIFTSLTVLLFYWLLKRFAVKWPFLFVMALLSSQPWLFRASLVKAPVVLLSLILLAFYFVSHKKYKSLAVISFLSVWLYAGWPLIPVIVILYVLLVWLLEKIKIKESLWQKVKNFLKIKKQQIIPWSAISYCLGGVVGGLTLNPYFPNNLKFYWQQIVKIAVINQQGIIGVGGEWYPYGLVKLVSDAPLACALLLVSILVFLLTFKKQSIYSWLWAFLSFGFFLLTLKSRRYVELFAPFIIIFSAFSLSDFIRYYSLKKIWADLGIVWQVVFSAFFILIALGFIINIPRDLKIAKRDIKNGLPLTHYQKASQYLKENSPQNSLVFNADWDDFPALFYYNDHNYYLIGLDPTFMYEQSPARYQQYVEVTLGVSRQNLGKVIHEQFKADYVFLDNNHRALEQILNDNADFKLVYKGEEGKVYKFTGQ